METPSALLTLCAGIHRPPVNSPHKGQWRGALIFPLICANTWANNEDAGDLRRHHTHYDVIVVLVCIIYVWGPLSKIPCHGKMLN